MASKASSSIAYRLGAIGLALAGSTLGGQALAQPAPGWYVGGNVGRATTDFDQRFIGVPAGTVTGINDDDSDTAWKLFGGYQFHRNFAVEGGYFDLGRYDYGYTTGAGAFSGSTRLQGLNLDLVGTLPLTDRFSAFAFPRREPETSSRSRS